MVPTQQGPTFRLELRRTFAAPRERVFRAWVEREALERWMCHDGDATEVRYLELDARPGGRYRMEVTMRNSGERYLLFGTYREVTPPERIAFTWAWERVHPDPGQVTSLGETLVTVVLFARGESTEILLTQEPFPTVKRRDEDSTGWNACFDALERHLPAMGSR
ncbi:MAG: SRPBCC family protein [Gemmatimonadales bacterium]